MAVTRVFQSGFELQKHGYDGWTITGSQTVATYPYETSSPTPNTGNACIKTNSALATGMLYAGIPATYQARVNAWLYIPSGGGVFQSSGFPFAFMGAAVASTTYLSIGVFVQDAEIRVYSGTTQLDSASITAIYDTWIPIGIDVKADNSTGYVRVWYNGIQVLDFSGDTIRGSYSEIIGFAISSYFSVNVGVNASKYVFVDDVTIEDTTGESVSATAPAMKKYHFVTPDGNGNYSDWVGSDADSTDNYLLVDDIPPDDDTSYVEGTSADRDSYTMTDVSVGSETIDAVIPLIVAKTGGTPATLQPFIREGGTNDDGAAAAVGTSYATLAHERFTTEPGGGAWDQTQVNAMEIGVLVP